MSRKRLGFGDFELDLQQRSLERDGENLELQVRTLDLLSYLARHPNETLSRKRLLSDVWGGVHVSDWALSSAIYQVRKVLDDTDRDPPWVRTVRGQGFRFEAPVRELVPPPARVPYFGRTDLLENLAVAREEAALGQGRLVLLEGDAGMGKTRTTEEIVRRAGDMRLARGWCDESDAAPAFWPWTQVLRELAPLELEGEISEVLGLQPGRTPPEELSWQEPSAAPRVDVLDGLARSLRAACERGPLIVILEDLHNADASSLAALEFVARRMIDWPLLLVATYRPGELESLGDSIGGIVSLPQVTRCELEPLEPAQVIALARHILGEAATQRVCTAIYERSGGNPFYVRSLVREFESHDGAEGELPRSIKAVLGRRLDRLSPGTREAVRVAALVGHRFDIELVDALVGPSVADWRDEAIAAGILELDSTPTTFRLRFSHALLREAAADELGPHQRAQLHRRIAALKLERYGSPRGEEVTDLAHHLAAALPVAGDGGASALRFCRMAAEEAMRATAWESCERHATVALEILRDRSGDEEPKELLELMALRCGALSAQGGRSNEIALVLDDAADLLARVQHDEVRAVFAGLRYVHERNLGFYDRAMRGVEELPAGWATLARMWRGTLQAIGGEFAAARDLIAEEPPVDARPTFVRYLLLDPSVLALASTSIACFALGEEQAALRRIERAMRLAEHENAVYSLALARFHACMLHELRGDLPSLAAEAARLDALATDRSIAPLLGAGFMFGAWADELQGRPRMPVGDLGAIVAPRFEQPEGGAMRGYAQSLVARFFEHADRFDEAQRHALAVRESSEEHGERWVLCETWRLLGRLAHAAGRVSEARDAFDAARDLAHKQHSPVFELRALRELHELDADAAVAREIERILSEPRELPALDRVRR